MASDCGAGGEVILVRYLDDVIVGFQYREDAERFLVVLQERLGQFGLTLHPDKTRSLEFGRFAARNCQRRGKRKPKTFQFLGFVHACGRTRAGWFMVRRHTVGKRRRDKLKEVSAELRHRWHAPIPEVGRWLGSVVRGHFASTTASPATRMPSSGSAMKCAAHGVRRCRAAARKAT
jgi:hypothetical protein